jgi:predicted Zn-dependent protease
MTLQHRPAVPASITYDEFVAAVVAGNGEEADEKLRSLAAADPNNPLLSEADLQRLVSNLVFTWGLGKEALPVIGLMNERYPSSPAGQLLLAEAEIAAGNYAQATSVYTQLLEQYPNIAIAKSLLEWLRSR